jgi:two-component system OmpR family sensor kinase
MMGNGQRQAWKPRWSVRSRILAATLLVAFIGMVVAGATAFLVQRDRILGGVDELLYSHVESARYVVTGVSDTITTGPVSIPAPDENPESDENPGSSENPESTASEEGDAPEEVTFPSTDDALEAVLARVIPGRNESALGIVGGQATMVPGVAIDFHLEDDPAFVARVVAETADGAVQIGTAETSGTTVRYIATPIAIDGDKYPAVYVAAVDVDAELGELRDAFTTYALVAACTLVAIGLVGWFVAGRLLRPLRRLRVAASRITASDRGERIPVVGRDDISSLTETVNGMLDRLDGAMTSQRQLLDDVRHELATPITIVRGHLELLEVDNVDEVEATRLLAIDELDRMARLVDDIESLTDSQRMTLSRTATDVGDLTEEVFAKASGIPGHEWVLESAAHVSAPLDAGRITQAWLQLVDNAAKYSPHGSRIQLGSTSGADQVEFWVADQGSGIPPGAEERIFERFGRADTGRGIRGSGLGLPIVQAIASAHGGRVSLVSSRNGSRFGIVIPFTDVAGVDEPTLESVGAAEK